MNVKVMPVAHDAGFEGHGFRVMTPLEGGPFAYIISAMYNILFRKDLKKEYVAEEKTNLHVHI